jgi:hypothetical protein
MEFPARNERGNSGALELANSAGDLAQSDDAKRVGLPGARGTRETLRDASEGKYCVTRLALGVL